MESSQSSLAARSIALPQIANYLMNKSRRQASGSAPLTRKKLALQQQQIAIPDYFFSSGAWKWNFEAPKARMTLSKMPNCKTVNSSNHNDMYLQSPPGCFVNVC